MAFPTCSAWLAPSRTTVSRPTSLALSREEYLTPHFETSSLKKPKSYDFDWERVLTCAQSTVGECQLEEMEQMMEELKAMDVDEATFGAFLSSEDGETRLALKHALESQVGLAKARQELAALGLGKDLPEVVDDEEEEPWTTPSVVVAERDIHDLLHQMRDIADHEEH